MIEHEQSLIAFEDPEDDDTLVCICGAIVFIVHPDNQLFECADQSCGYFIHFHTGVLH